MHPLNKGPILEYSVIPLANLTEAISQVDFPMAQSYDKEEL